MSDLAEIPNLLPAGVEIFLAVVAMALLMFGVFQRAGDGVDIGVSRTANRLALMALAVAILFVALSSSDGPETTFNDLFIVDSFALFFKVLVLAAAALCLFVSQEYLEAEGIARFEYPVLILLAVLGMMMMISANDFISLYIGLEMQSLALYIIAAFHRDNIRSTEAGLKYFVLGALASGMLLYGASLVYGFSGTTNFQTLAALFGGQAGEPVPTGLIVGLVFILAGLAFKVSAVPFHMWTPDVYEGAPTPVTAFFAVVPKLAAVALFVRVMIDPFGDLVPQWQQIVVFISVASMVLGAFAAIGQKDIKRLMAYSSIGNIGYMLIGLAVGTEAGVRGILIYLAIYVAMTLGAFTVILCMRRNDTPVTEIADLAGLSKTNPVMAFALAIFMFSLAGIPPLAGFFAKLYIFLAAVEAGFFALAIIGVLASVVAAFYYIRIVKVMYFDDAVEPLDRRFGRDARIVMLASTAFVLFFFLYPSPVLTSAANAAQSLFAH